jgi:hypothetical protein
MVDIETLGTNNNAPITNIGVYAFDFIRTQEDIPEKDLLHLHVRWDDQTNRTPDVGAIKFWFGQNELVRKELTSSPRLPLKTALMTLRDFIRGATVWANGASFDLGVLKNAYTQLGMGVPWTFRQEMCMRPLRLLALQMGDDPKRITSHAKLIARDFVNGTKHNALYDALFQGLCVQLFYKSYLLGIGYEPIKANPVKRDQ